MRAALAAIATAVLLGACTGPGSGLPTFETGEVAEYRLGEGDRVRVIVFGQPDLTEVFLVNNFGAVSMPLIGSIDAQNKTTDELEQSIETVLADGLLSNPSVSVEIVQYRPFYILGEVAAPGEYEYRPGMTVLTAVTVGGGFTERAEKEYVTITRNIDNVPTEGRALPNTLVQSGDVVYVRERYF